MRKFTLTLDLGGAAFEEEGDEVARILTRLAHNFEHCLDVGGSGFAVSLFDINGNRCGSYAVDGKKD